MASLTCHAVAGAKQFRLERIVRARLEFCIVSTEDFLVVRNLVVLKIWHVLDERDHGFRQ